MGTSGSGQFKSVDPTKAILPILLIDTAKGKIKDLLGTGFFFSDRPTILSCAHVLGRAPGPDELVGVPRYQGPEAEPGVIAHHEVVAIPTNVRKHATLDLAVADVADVTDFEHFTFRSSDPSDSTRTLMTIDLASRTTFEPGPMGGEPVWTITPYAWKGYAHTVLISQEIGMRAPAKILEVSIPVVKGMSGAPLIDGKTLEVAGILFGNVARSLVPAPQAETESQAWYLPIGQAFHWSEASEFLKSLRLTP
jgi:hypothetical protein